MTRWGAAFVLVAVTMSAPSPVGAAARSASGGWQPAESLTTFQLPGGSIPERSGRTPDGFLYTYRANGAAHIYPFTNVLAGPGVNLNGWDISCPKDALTDERRCDITFTGSNMVIQTDARGLPFAFCVVGQADSNRPAAIRFDKDTAITMNDHGCDLAAGIVSRMQATTTILVRRYATTNGPAEDVTVELRGTASALALARFIVQNIESVPFR